MARSRHFREPSVICISANESGHVLARHRDARRCTQNRCLKNTPFRGLIDCGVVESPDYSGALFETIKSMVDLVAVVMKGRRRSLLFVQALTQNKFPVLARIT